MNVRLHMLFINNALLLFYVNSYWSLHDFEIKDVVLYCII